MSSLRTGAFILLLLALPLSASQRPQGPIATSGLSAISGTVLGDDGNPVAGVVVARLRPTFDDNGTKQSCRRRSGIRANGPVGKYVLSGLAPDIYVVSVYPVSRGARRFVTVYYPDVPIGILLRR